MKRAMIVMLLTALLLIGCSRETQVWLPEEEVVELQGKDVVRIPVGEETQPTPTEPTEAMEEETEPVPTQPAQTEKANITRKPSTTPKKNTNKETTVNKETVTGTGDPVSSEPSVTEAPETEPPVTEPPFYDISDYQLGDLEYEVLERINDYRAEESLDSLWMDSWLCAIASCRSYEASRVWSHTRPDGRGFATVLRDYDYSAGAAQELLVYDSGSGNAETIVDRWMGSQSQRELLLSNYTTAGIGVYRVNGLVYVTCLLVK